MERRHELQKILEDIMLRAYPDKFPDMTGPSKYHVYFQPADSLAMEYPCIRYQRDALTQIHANNDPYHQTKRYMITILDRSADSPIFDLVAGLRMTRFVSHNRADGIHHDVFTTSY